MMRKNRIKKFIIGVFVSSLLLLFLINTFEAKGSVSNLQPKTIVVQKGDTLWSIAKNNCSSFRDIRNVIYEIRDYNGLKSASIVPGQKIKIPPKFLNN